MHDYGIVGAGSAGCVLARRLSAICSNQVLLLEPGGPDDSPFIHTPAMMALLPDHWAPAAPPQRASANLTLAERRPREADLTP